MKAIQIIQIVYCICMVFASLEERNVTGDPERERNGMCLGKEQEAPCGVGLAQWIKCLLYKQEDQS